MTAGRIGLVDHDVVDVSNLHRQVWVFCLLSRASLQPSILQCTHAATHHLWQQVIHTEARVGVPKAVSAALSITALNSSTKAEPHVCEFTRESAVRLVEQYDVVLDASDNPPTRYLIR